MSELAPINPANVKKTSSPAANKKTTPQTESCENSKRNYTSVVLTGLGAVGVIGAAILAIKMNQTADAVKIIGVQQFKNAGNKFLKGKALTSKGEPFTGVLLQTVKNGNEKEIHYVNGFLEKVITFKPGKHVNGKLVNVPLSKKVYQYNEAGKLKTFFWRHVSLTDPKPLNNTRLKQDAETLKQKEIKELKEQEIKKKVKEIKQHLSKETEINSSTIDSYFERSEAVNDKSHLRLLSQYEQAEKNEQAVKENVAKLKEHMHKKTDINADTINRQFETNSEIKELNEYLAKEEKYLPIAERMNNRIESKISPRYSNPYKYSLDMVEKLPDIPNIDRKMADKNIFAYSLGYEPGRVSLDKNTGELFMTLTSNNQKIYFDNGKWAANDVQNFKNTLDNFADRFPIVNKDAKVRISKDGSFSVASNDTKTVFCNGSSDRYKIFVKNKNGKYELSNRVTNLNVKDPVDGEIWKEKTVEHLNNGLKKGLTRVTYSGNNKEMVLIRDKKGKILEVIRKDASKPAVPPAASKELNLWYKEYLKMCKEEGIQPRAEGYWMHYRELCMKKNNPAEYESYIRIRNYRSKYNQNAAELRFLDEAPELNKKTFDEVSKIIRENKYEFHFDNVKFLCKALEEKRVSKKDLDEVLSYLYGERVNNYHDFRIVLEIILDKINNKASQYVSQSNYQQQSQKFRMFA